MNNYRFNKKMAKQRAKRGYSDDMCWGMYYWFLETLPKMIIDLRDMKNGYPELEFEEINNFSTDWVEFASEELEDFDIHDGFSRWQLILTRISWCLKQADENLTEIENEYKEKYFNQVFGENHEIQENENFKDWWNRRFEKVELGYVMKVQEPEEEIKEKYFNKEKDIAEYRNQMKNEAFDLIKKYFWNLWD